MKDEAVDNGELWRSDDGGTNWNVVSYHRHRRRHDLPESRSLHRRVCD